MDRVSNESVIPVVLSRLIMLPERSYRGRAISNQELESIRWLRAHELVGCTRYYQSLVILL